MFFCRPTAIRCPGEGPSPPKISPSTTFPATDPFARDRRKARSKPRIRAPSKSSPKGSSDCSIDLGNTISKPTTLAPPSMTALRTRPISVVQVRVGDPWNGGVSEVSSSSAITTTGAEPGSRRAPNTSQRSAVRASIDQPWMNLKGGRTEKIPHVKATRMIATASRLMTLPIAVPGYRTRSAISDAPNGRR